MQALRRVRENLEHAHNNLLVNTADVEMRRWARQLARTLERMQQKIADEEGRLAQLEAEEAEGLRARAEREKNG